MKSLALLLVAAASTFAFADGNKSEATAKAAVHVYAPVVMISNQDMNFGSIVLDNLTEDASVTLDPTDGTLKAWSKATKYVKSAAPSLAWFHYHKDAALSVTVTLPASVDLGSGVKLVPSKGNDETCVLFTLAKGEDATHFDVGGTLTIPAGKIGKFEGSLKAEVAYN